MSLYVLDTDILSLYQQGHALIHSRILSLAPGELAITVLSVEEQIAGRFASVRMLSRLPILSFTQQAIARNGQLVALKLNIGKMDLRIAAVVLENGGVLVTRNLRDFQRVPNLAVENWAV